MLIASSNLGGKCNVNELEQAEIQKDLSKGKPNFIPYLVSAGALLFVIVLALGYFIYNQNEELNLLKNELGTVPGKIDSLSSKVKLIEEGTKPKEGEKSLQEQINNLNRQNYINSMQHRIEGGVVTDDFVVEKVTILALPALDKDSRGVLVISADLTNQPAMIPSYKGQGLFNIPDRELKSKLTDLVDKIKEQYGGNERFGIVLPEFNDGSVLLSVRNYDIAKYQNGELLLKGEY